jgi:hypothetical protein
MKIRYLTNEEQIAVNTLVHAMRYCKYKALNMNYLDKDFIVYQQAFITLLSIYQEYFCEE